MPEHHFLWQCEPHAAGCSNDAFDAEMGVDAAKAESVVNLTGSRGAVLWAANGFLAAALTTFAGALRVAVCCHRCPIFLNTRVYV